MGTRLLVNDLLTCIPGTRTFWSDLKDWFHMDFVEAPYDKLAEVAAIPAKNASLIIRNATWFGPIKAKCPQIALLQDIATDGPIREMQEAVIESSRRIVYNSEFTRSKYGHLLGVGVDGYNDNSPVVPLPVDFDLFKPGNPIGLQQELGLLSGCVCWVGSQHPIKGYDTFIHIVRMNPDIPFVGVFKDAAPVVHPPNLRCYEKILQPYLAKIMGACSVGLCTSVMESQHLAGIEMGACGIPIIVPNIGTYWGREAMGFPGTIYSGEVRDRHPAILSSAIRTILPSGGSQPPIRDYWRKEFDREVIKAQWTKLIEEVENV